MDLSTLKMLFVIFHPGTGGNHLCNMLSLSNRLYRKRPATDYISDLVNRYTGITPEKDAAHFGSAVVIHPASPTPIQKNIELIQSTSLPVIVQGHLPDVVPMYPRFKNLGKVGLILLEWDEHTDITHRKYPAHFLIGNPVDKRSYSKPYIQKIFKLSDDDVYTIPVNDLITSDANNLYTRLSNDLQLNLNIDDCNRIHEIWYSKFFTAN